MWINHMQFTRFSAFGSFLAQFDTCVIDNHVNTNRMLVIQVLNELARDNAIATENMTRVWTCGIILTFPYVF